MKVFLRIQKNLKDLIDTVRPRIDVSRDGRINREEFNKLGSYILEEYEKLNKVTFATNGVMKVSSHFQLSLHFANTYKCVLFLVWLIIRYCGFSHQFLLDSCRRNFLYIFCCWSIEKRRFLADRPDSADF